MTRAEIISLTDIKELRKYAVTSFDLIQKMQEDKRLLEVEVAHLQEILRNVPSVPTLSEPKPLIRVELEDGMPDEVQAAHMQAAVLKAKATNTTLEFQETKQLESYHKILSSWRAEQAAKNKNKKSDLESLSDEELLRLASDE